MKIVSATVLAGALVLLASAALAYSTKSNGGSVCLKDGSACNVYCDSNTLAGTMYWNGGVWSDGVRTDPDKDGEAKKIVAANGSACT
jgi:hypothetical protein